MLSLRVVCCALSTVCFLSVSVNAENAVLPSQVMVKATDHPFLMDAVQVPWSRLTPDRVRPDMTLALTKAEAAVEEICSLPPDKMDYARTFGALATLQTQLDVHWGRVELLNGLRDEPKLREAVKEMMPRVSEFQSSLTKNKVLWEVLKKAQERISSEPLSHDQARWVSECMIQFRDSGADLPVLQQERVMQIDKAISDATKKFSDMVLDNQNSWELVVEDETELAGLSEAVKAEAAKAASAEGQSSGKKWKFTISTASTGGLMTDLKSDALRQKVWEGMSSVGTGNFDTDPLIREILKLREEKAKLCGYENYPDFILKRRMAGSGKNALKFVDDLQQKIAKPFEKEMVGLKKFKEKKTAQLVDKMNPWEMAYWESLERKELFSYDQEEVRPYFPVDNVLKEIFFITSSLYDIEVKESRTVCLEPNSTSSPEKGVVEVWHPSVRFFEVYDRKTEEHLGSFYMDLHPRKGKRSGAWLMPLVAGCPATDDQPRKPHVGIIGANVRPPMGDLPALLSPREIRTLFHETGHLMHQMLSNVSVPTLSGTNVAWDFVELPSQIMENWCWEKSILKSMSSHYQTGEKIPDGLVDSLVKSRFYHPAADLMGQLATSKLDLELHRNPAVLDGVTIEQADEKILKGYVPVLSCRAPSRARGMRHLFADSVAYSAGYYSYRWAELLEADAFSRFSKEGILNPKVGDAFRREILEKGNLVSAEELFRNFMGRNPDKNAMLKRRGLVKN